MMALISLYLIFTNHEDHIFNGFPTQVNVTICLVIGSRKPSDQLASNIYINVIPISIALSKFLSCDDIILLEVHFFLEENRYLESSKILVENSSLSGVYAYFESELLHWHPYSEEHIQSCAKM